MHTPGPWTARCRHIGYDSGDWPTDEFLQWEVLGPEEPTGRGSFFQGDARLIAAAPDLLSALQSFMHEFGDKAERATFINARAAINKATGA